MALWQKLPSYSKPVTTLAAIALTCIITWINREIVSVEANYQPPTSPSLTEPRATESHVEADARHPVWTDERDNQQAPANRQVAELNIPVMYQPMLDDAREIEPRFAEKLESFERGPIDTEWAPTTEVGISDYFAYLGPQNDLVLEFVHCRSTSCLVLGVLGRTPPDDSTAIKALQCRIPWWVKTGPCYTLIGKSADNNQFVVLVTRESH